jgi:RimJ/RimL family protein N-acetyltransferase
VRLIEIGSLEIESIARGEQLAWPVAPGWPHDNTLIGLSFAGRGGAAFLIVDDDDRIAGECGTKSPPRADGGVEIGYGLAAPSRGQGLGTQAVGELLDWLEARPDIRYVEAEIHETNLPSTRLAVRLGFVVHSGPEDGYYRFRRPTQPK